MPPASLRFLLLLPLALAGCSEMQSGHMSQAALPAASIAAPAEPHFNPGGPDMARYADASGQFPPASRRTWWQTSHSVDGFSRLDQILSANTVRKPETPSPWRRATGGPTITYAMQQTGSRRFSIDEYLARNPATGLLIAQGDTIHVERYQYGRTDTHRLTSFSMAKTVTALLVGLAVADGAIASIDDPAERYVPDLKDSEYGRTPIRHLLTMSSGVRFDEDYSGRDDVSRMVTAMMLPQSPGGPAAVRQFNQRIAPPGQRWSYASAETQVLGLVLRAAIKRPIAEYLSERIWQPIGAESDASWIVDGSGQEATFAYFNAVLRDYARLGMLLANGGKVDERQVIPADWLREMTRPHFTSTQTGRWFGYGFQTWIFPDNDGSFALLGVRGQAIYVDPARRLVMVHTAVRPQARDPGGAETTALWRGVKAAFARQPG
ncbi:MAG: serine hydrolase domain-containing protein [Ferrovibrio sp.]|uniref:serine hydrolase domain-containing protein n=1 Tax=Ferrovibrio sp. TaxID=1917215 RepID=UPI003919F6F6